MPYGISKKMGGDNKRNDRKMEKQVAGIMRSGVSKKSAIKIAKAQAKKRGHV